MSVDNPCTSCGACCACFRVSFYWGETSAAPGGGVPAELTLSISPHRVALLGTHLPEPRCVALEGTVGQRVRCSIYPLRPSPCREFAMAGEQGLPNEACDRARARFGLPPLSAPDSHDPQGRPPLVA